MNREVKQDWDYKELHISGSKIIKPVDMANVEKLRQLELDCIVELDEYVHRGQQCTWYRGLWTDQ